MHAMINPYIVFNLFCVCIDDWVRVWVGSWIGLNFWLDRIEFRAF